MVNYCCVDGCGRNSRTSKQLYYYSLPKEKHRRDEWLKAVGLEYLLKKNDDTPEKLHQRVCSRHFLPDNIKNKHLHIDAVPTLYLPGTLSDEISSASRIHQDIVCNSCSDPVSGFRYKCLSCDDYDLCLKCEMQEVHTEHHMIRIPRPGAEMPGTLRYKLRKFFNPHPTDTMFLSDNSSDDEPLTSYKKTLQYDSGVDLSDDIKTVISNEVKRILKSKAEKRPAEPMVQDTCKKYKSEVANVPEVAFADVNNVCEITDVKDESRVFLTEAISEPRVVRLKLSDDLSELMIEDA